MKALAPFLLQGFLLWVDEFACHRHRTLKKWERWGHPIDTTVFLACLLWLQFTGPSARNLIIYSVLSVLSCLVVSKDEWQHKELSSGFENWLHSLLFMLHPSILIWSAWLWWNGANEFQPTLEVAAIFVAAFGIYQAVYWNLWRHDQQ